MDVQVNEDQLVQLARWDYLVNLDSVAHKVREVSRENGVHPDRQVRQDCQEHLAHEVDQDCLDHKETVEPQARLAKKACLENRDLVDHLVLLDQQVNVAPLDLQDPRVQ